MAVAEDVVHVVEVVMGMDDNDDEGDPCDASHEA